MNNSNNEQQTQQQQLRQRLRQVQAEEAALQKQLADVQEFAARYPIRLAWPAAIASGNRRTRTELLQHRLLEAGILYEVPTTAADTVQAARRFVHNLEATDCFHAVSVEIGGASDAPSAQQQQRQPSQRPQSQQDSNNNETPNDDDKLPEERTLRVTLHERNWYRLHAGAGLKTGGALGSGGGSASGSSQQQPQHAQCGTSNGGAFLPTAELEFSAGLRNACGVFDRTDLQYSVDTHNIGTWSLSHARPLYAAPGLPALMSDYLLQQPRGSQFHFKASAALDTLDRTAASRYREYQRLASVRAATHPAAAAGRERDDNDPWYASLDWSVAYRDLVPQRHATLPYHLAASPEIVAAAGASVKHSVTARVKHDSTTRWTGGGSSDNNHNRNDGADLSGLPTNGVQWDGTTELALPPGDVGFVRAQAAVAGHACLAAVSLPKVSLHATLGAGAVRSLSFRGLCSCGPGPSDRFLLGGTGSFRGFVPAGLGPRSSSTSSTTTSNNNSNRNSSRQQAGGAGDALGGDFFYTATVAASTAPPAALAQSPVLGGLARRVRLFGFATAGTCCNVAAAGGAGAVDNTTYTGVSARDVVRSTRLSAGVGLATQALGGPGAPRLEVTYAWPLRYGPRDGRRRLQFGVSLALD